MRSGLRLVDTHRCTDISQGANFGDAGLCVRKALKRAFNGALMVALVLSLSPLGHFRSARAAVAEDFLVVDCLLPGKIRKLGKIRAFMTARRPIRTSKSDCEIRGGEYTSFDRSNYETALQIWMPLAQDGDAKAQNYVGELYEKGIGGAPRYSVAADWYRKAADQGLSAAQVNLGALYERGLGFEKDSETATFWYRKAAGLDVANVDFIPGVRDEELTRLRLERNAATADRERLNKELEQLKQRLEGAQQQLQDRSQNSSASSGKLQKADLERRAVKEGQLKQQITDLKQKMADLARQMEATTSNKESELAAYRQEARDLREMVAAQQAEFGEKEQRVAELTIALSARETALAEQIERTRETKTAEESSTRMAEAAATEMVALKDALANARGESATSATKAQEMARRLKEMEGKLAKAAIKEAQPGGEPIQVAGAGPVITIIDPPLVETRASQFRSAIVRAPRKTHVVIGQIASRDDLMMLKANDAEVPVDENSMFRINVPVEGNETEVSVVAVDVKGQRSALAFKLIKGSELAQVSPVGPNGLVIDPKGLGVEFGRYHAVVIGNNAYQHLPDLKSARYDAEKVSTMLRDNYGFKVTTLYNASRYDILSTLNKFREELTDEDNFLLYYAGHGELDRVNQRGHWLPVDAEPNSTANWISNVQITDVLNAMSARQVMLVVDSCYSGTLTRAGLARLDSGMSDPMRRKWIEMMSEKRSRVVLTSGGVQPVLDGGGDGHSVFARAFLNALRENLGILEGQRLFQMVSAEVASAAANSEFEQIPQYAPIKFAGHEAGDFFLLPTRTN